MVGSAIGQPFLVGGPIVDDNQLAARFQDLSYPGRHFLSFSAEEAAYRR
jgi:uncharacterized protein YbbC (DUF1343 family)